MSIILFREVIEQNGGVPDLNKVQDEEIKFKQVSYEKDGVKVDRYIYGPFKATWSKGSISSKTVTGITDMNNPTQVNITNYQIVDETGTKSINIESGKNFYISVDTSVKAISSVEIKASTPVKTLWKEHAKYAITIVPHPTPEHALKHPKIQTHGFEMEETIDRSDDGTASKTIKWETELPKTIRILKLDYDDKVNNEKETPLPDIEFILKYETSDGVRYVKQNEKDLTITYVINKEEATTFVTDKDGVILVQGLKPGKYTFIETKNPYHGYQNIKNINDTREIEVKSESQALIRYTAYNRKLVGNINIEKVNSKDSSVKLSDVEFVLYADVTDYSEDSGNPNVIRKYVKAEVMGKEGFQTGQNNKLYGEVNITKQEYTDNIEEATIFVTNKEGKLSINNLALAARHKNLEIGKQDICYYEIIEIKNPHYGYELDNNYITWEVPDLSEGEAIPNPVNTSLWFIPKNQTDTNITVGNEQKYVKISGYVWEDRPNGKENTRNDLYQETAEDHDKLVEGIKVVLHNTKTGKSYEKWTDSNGEYIFGGQNADGTYMEDNILLRDIDNYYVEFIYNGMKYTNVIPNTAKENGSKSAEGSYRQPFNDKYSTVIGNTTKGNDGATQGQLLDTSGNKTADIYYTQPRDNESQITYTEGKEYADSSKKIKLNDYYAVDKYHISATTKETGYSLKNTFVTGHTEEIKNINLGIYEREQIDLAVSSDIEDVKVELNGYTHTYHYATRNKYVKNDGAFNVGVKFGDKYLNRYTRTIYQSAVSYFAEDRNNNKLEVDVIYKITIANQSTEQLKAIFNQINNYYDKQYTPQEVYYMSGETKIPLSSSVGGKTYANDRFNVLQINLSDIGYVAGGATSQIYIRFKLSDEAVLGLLNGDATLDNLTEISSYSTYTSSGEHYASVDEDSAVDNVAVELDNNNRFIKTTFEDDTDMAPSLVLQADKNNIISGTVFEDSQTEQSRNKNERLGNGIYEENTENVVVNAKVELLEVYDDNDVVDLSLKGTIKYDEQGNPIVATLYQMRVGEDGKAQKVLIKAETYTDDNGNYQFIGIIPDGYVVRYTYGEGTKIKEKATGNYRDIDARDYKSTIIASNEIRKALNIQPDTATIEGRGNYNWNILQEKDEAGNVIRYSDAADEIIERMKQEQEDEVLNYSIMQTQERNMKARTATFIIGVEFENINSASNVYLMNTEGEVVLDESRNPIPDPNFYSENKNLDFGIILRPIVELTLDKNLTNMSIQLANGQMLVNGNPYEQDLPYTRAVEDNVYVDMDADLIQGAALNIEYEIKLINNSEVDYKFTNLSTSDSKAIAGRRYYYFGDNTGAEKIDKYIKLVGDYLDGELVYDINEMNEGLKDGWQITTAEKLYEEGRISRETLDELIKGKQNIFTTTEFNEGLEASSHPGASTSKTVKVKVSKLLGAKDELVFTNDAEILEISAIARTTGLNATPGNLLPERAVEKDEDSVKLVIMPPTGSNNHIAYILTGIGSLLIVVAGIILIKKKIWR